MEQEEVVYLKVFDKKRGGVVFEEKVSTDVEPHELVKLRCFRKRYLSVFHSKATNEQVTSFKGLQNNFELVAGDAGRYKHFSGVLSVASEDKVLRKSKCVPSCECVMMTACYLSQEECEKVFTCETLEQLEINGVELIEVPKDIGKLKKLKKLSLDAMHALEGVAEEMGELSNLEDLQIEDCDIESLPKRWTDLKKLRSIHLLDLAKLHLNAEDAVAFSKLKHLKILNCSSVWTPSFTQSFWEMIKSTTDLRVLELDWNDHNHELLLEALEENGCIVDGGLRCELYAHIFIRNAENHERAMECVVCMLSIRRWRNALNNVPKEMVIMIAMMLWNTKCDVGAWTRRSNE